MRITDSGFGQGQGSGRQDRDRAAAFRNKHRVGERLKGTLVKRESKSLAWILIDGHHLLANIETDSEPGSSLNFMVLSLYPEIVLKALPPGGGSGGYPLAGAIQEFGLARAKLEGFMGLNLSDDTIIGLSPEQRRTKFLEAVAADKKLTAIYARLCAQQLSINSRLAQSGPTRFLYLPWLMPGARGLEALLKSEPKENGVFMEFICGFELDRIGAGQIRVLYKKPRAGFRVFMDRPENIKGFLDYVKSTSLGPLPVDAQCLGVEKLPRYAHGGTMRELLSPSVHRIMGFKS